MDVTVRSGDTLWYYSQLFDVPLQLVLDSNPELDPRRLMIGHSVTIPGYVKHRYTLKQGDTFWKIATTRQIPLDALLLMNSGLNPTTLQVGQSINIPLRARRPVVNVNQPYDFQRFERDLNRLMMLYPFIRKRTIGQSVLNQPLYELEIGHGSERVHIDGSFHAREWITTPVIMLFLNEYLQALTNGKTIRGLSVAPFYDNKTLSVVPLVNPDGVDLVINGPPDNPRYRELVLEINNGSTDFSKWKANIRGVDLNNQFPANWDIEAARKPDHPSPANYPGPEPLSEPETQAMAELTRNSDFARVLAFHTQGEVIYWGYMGYEPPASETLVNEFSRVSGYAPIRYVDSHAGYKDWFIQDWRRPGFTIECGLGESPLPLSQFDEIYQECLGIFLANLYM